MRTHTLFGICRQSYIFSLALICLVSMTCAYWTDVEKLKPGAGSFIFKEPYSQKEMRVWYYRPHSSKNPSQIVFVMHGAFRNGMESRDTWIAHAKKSDFLLIVPEFSEKDYPGYSAYNLGNILSADGTINNESLWSYTVIESLFDHVKLLTHSKVSGYSIYGHSAGAQFVHRLLMFRPEARIRIAIAANAGWYTLPTDSITFPYGLRNSGITESNLVAPFAKTLVLLLGDQDTGKEGALLRKTPEAMAQGKHRLERGHFFYQMAERAAAKLKTRLKWKLMEVSGVGHDKFEMSPHAARLLAEYFNGNQHSLQSDRVNSFVDFWTE